MKKTYKVIALLSTAFALAACQSGEKKVDETAAQTTVAQATRKKPHVARRANCLVRVFILISFHNDSFEDQVRLLNFFESFFN